jgi:hypothetical protein
MNHKEFVGVMAFLSAAYPRYQLTDETLEAYRAIVGDLSVDLLRAAALQIASRDSPWFPSAGELRSAAFRLLEREAGVPSAGEAWGEVVRLIGTDGHIRVPEFSNPLIKMAVDGVGGWRELCFSENSVADRARFLQVYEVLAKREREAAVQLPAVAEAVKALAAGESRMLEVGNG